MKRHILLPSKKKFAQIFHVIFQPSYIFTSLYPTCLASCLSSCPWCSCWCNVNFPVPSPCTWKENSTRIHVPPTKFRQAKEWWEEPALLFAYDPWWGQGPVILSLKRCLQRGDNNRVICQGHLQIDNTELEFTESGR